MIIESLNALSVEHGVDQDYPWSDPRANSKAESKWNVFYFNKEDVYSIKGFTHENYSHAIKHIWDLLNAGDIYKICSNISKKILEWIEVNYIENCFYFHSGFEDTNVNSRQPSLDMICDSLKSTITAVAEMDFSDDFDEDDGISEPSMILSDADVKRYIQSLSAAVSDLFEKGEHFTLDRFQSKCEEKLCSFGWNREMLTEFFITLPEEVCNRVESFLDSYSKTDPSSFFNTLDRINDKLINEGSVLNIEQTIYDAFFKYSLEYYEKMVNMDNKPASAFINLNEISDLGELRRILAGEEGLDGIATFSAVSFHKATDKRVKKVRFQYYLDLSTNVLCIKNLTKRVYKGAYKIGNDKGSFIPALKDMVQRLKLICDNPALSKIIGKYKFFYKDS